MFTFDEMPGSGEATSATPGLTLKYRAAGVDDENWVWSYALGATPYTVWTPLGTLYRQDVQISPAGFAIKEVTVPYGPKKNETGSYTFSFDSTGGTVRITSAKEHIQSYDSGGPASPSDPHSGSIGVQSDGKVEGVDITIPALKLSVSFRHPAGVITMSQVKNLARATGKTNSSSFIEFDAGELLFLGATGSDGSEAEAEVTYQFAASENATGLTFGDIAGIAKKGHEYCWIEYKDNTDYGLAGTVSRFAHVERVYDELDFASVFGWG